MPNIVLGAAGVVIGFICAALGASFLLTMLIIVLAFLFLKFVPILGTTAPLSYSIPQLIKDLARARRLPVNTIPWAFFEGYGSIVVGQAKLLSPRKPQQAEFAVACARDLVDDMCAGTVKTPEEWNTHVATRRISWAIV
jgi:hypothetical protein